MKTDSCAYSSFEVHKGKQIAYLFEGSVMVKATVLKIKLVVCAVILTFFATEALAQTDDSIKHALHTVRKGDTLYSISRLSCVKISTIQNANGIGHTLSLGKQLKIPLVSGHCWSRQVQKPDLGNKSQPPQKADQTTTYDITIYPARNVTPVSVDAFGDQPPNTILVSKISYAVLPADTLYSVARKSCVSISELKRVNNITDSNAISPGMILYLPVDNCIGSSAAYRPIKPELKLSDAQKQAELARREVQSKRPRYSGGVEDWTGGSMDCSRKSATDTGDNGLTAEECFAAKDKQRDENIKRAEAERANQKVYTEAPNGFIAFLANQDVQKAIIDTSNNHYQQKAEDAQISKRLADDDYRSKIRSGQLNSDGETYVASKAQKEHWDRNAVEAKRKTDAWMWELKEKARKNAEEKQAKKRALEKLERAHIGNEITSDSKGSTKTESVNLGGQSGSNSNQNPKSIGKTKVYSGGACSKPQSIKLKDGTVVEPRIRVIKLYKLARFGHLDSIRSQERLEMRVDEKSCLETYSVPTEAIPFQGPGQSHFGIVGETHGSFYLSEKDLIKAKQNTFGVQPSIDVSGYEYYYIYDDKAKACSLTSLRNKQMSGGLDVSGLSKYQLKNLNANVLRAASRFRKECPNY